jgi:hypothetical protein
MTLALVILALLTCLVLGLRVWRWSDHRADQRVWDELLATQPRSPARFDPASVADLPDPARRYFEFTILPGTPLYTVAEITMTGRFGLGTKDAPNYLDMTAHQLLAAPTGFVWKMRVPRGRLRLSGSDATHWTRFWWMDLLPIARAGGTADHTRSAFGRYVAEAVFWTPAALLPGPGIAWQTVDEVTARVVVTHGGLEQAVDVRVDEIGRPVQVSLMRWSDANAEKVFRLAPFGGVLSEFREFEGFRLPTHVEAGHGFGTEGWWAFFVGEVGEVGFPGKC